MNPLEIPCLALIDALEEMLADQQALNPPYRNQLLCDRAEATLAEAKRDVERYCP